MTPFKMPECVTRLEPYRRPDMEGKIRKNFGVAEDGVVLAGVISGPDEDVCFVLSMDRTNGGVMASASIASGVAQPEHVELVCATLEVAKPETIAISPTGTVVWMLRDPLPHGHA